MGLPPALAGRRLRLGGADGGFRDTHGQTVRLVGGGPSVALKRSMEMRIGMIGLGPRLASMVSHLLPALAALNSAAAE